MTIGSDPEGVWIDRKTGAVVRHRDLRSMGFTSFSPRDVIGADGESGNSLVMEMRPRHGDSAEQHFLNVKDLINTAYEIHKASGGSIGLLSGHSDHPVGGHIHIGDSRLICSSKTTTTAASRLEELRESMVYGGFRNFANIRREFIKESKKIEESISNARDVVSNLDYWLAPLLLPLFPKEVVSRRQRDRYGFVGDWRNQKHGIEYRTLPSWINHPVVTRGTLAMAELITKLTLEKKIMRRIRGKDVEWIKSHYNTDSYPELIELRSKTVPALLSELKGTKEYEAIKEMIELLKHPVSLDVFHEWGYELAPADTTPILPEEYCNSVRKTPVVHCYVSRTDDEHILELSMYTKPERPLIGLSPDESLWSGSVPLTPKLAHTVGEMIKVYEIESRKRRNNTISRLKELLEHLRENNIPLSDPMSPIFNRYDSLEEGDEIPEYMERIFQMFADQPGSFDLTIGGAIRSMLNRLGPDYDIVFQRLHGTFCTVIQEVVPPSDAYKCLVDLSAPISTDVGIVDFATSNSIEYRLASDVRQVWENVTGISIDNTTF